MIHWRLRLSLRVFGREAQVPLRQCVHYGAFRYGRAEEHPYETYVRLLSEPDGHASARKWLVDFVRHYRPRHMGQALGTDLDTEHALWSYPWESVPRLDPAWLEDPLALPDIVTHYSEAGVPWFRIEQEFFWLEQAYHSIRSQGFRPEFGERICAQKLVAASGTESFLILDGNHRISALSALGYETVGLIYLPKRVVHEARIEEWPQVRSGRFSVEDARRVFRAYFDGNGRWHIAMAPAPLLWNPNWL